VQENAQESIGLSEQALAGATGALEELETRWVGMVVALVVILITIVALVLIKREIDRDLEARRAHKRTRA
jgi:bacteriorhodopsin